MNAVFIDTSAWIAVMVRKDHNNREAVACFEGLLKERIPLVTSDYVLDETLTRIRYDSGHHKAVEFYNIIKESREKGYLIMKRIDEALWDEAFEIFRQYGDKKFSFTDCTSFALARKLKVNRVFAFDEDFRAMKFTVIP
jgi:uncharacterized protein